MTKYHALLKKSTRMPIPLGIDICAINEPIVKSCISAMEGAGIKVLDWNFGPLASVTFEGDPAALPEEVCDQFEAIGNAELPMYALGNFSPGFAELLEKPKPGYYATIQHSLPRIGMDQVKADPDWNNGSTIIFGILDTGLDEDYYRNVPPYRGEWYFLDRIIEHWQAYPWSGTKNLHCRLCLSVMMKSRHEYEGQVWEGGMPKARAYVAQVLDGQGYGTTGTVHEGFVWLSTRNPLPMIVNCSLGGTQCDPVLHADIKRLFELGVLVSIASGNNGVFPPPCNGRINCPADSEENMAVGATDGGYENPGNPEMAQTWVSRNNRKDGTKQMHFVSAPGVRIQVEMGEPAGTGTSLAAPHNALVLGVSWLFLLLRYPQWSYPELASASKAIVESTCFNLGYKGSPNYSDEEAYCIQGFGRVDAYQAMLKAKGAGPGLEKIVLEMDGEKIHEWDFEGAGTYTHQIDSSSLASGIKELKTTLPNGEFKKVKFEVYEEEEPLKPYFDKPKEGERFRKGDPVPVEVTVK